MNSAYVDVRLELNLDSLTGQLDPTAYIVETARAEADRLCDRSGARLRTDHVPEFDIQRAQNRVTGEMCMLVSTRWACDVPAGTPMGPPR